MAKHARLSIKEQLSRLTWAVELSEAQNTRGAVVKDELDRSDTGADPKNHKRPEFGEKQMTKRGRKSVAELSIVPVVPDQSKPAPPPTLTAPEAEIWEAVVEDTPAGWFSAAQEPLLAAYCRHVAMGNLLSVWIDQNRPETLGGDALRRYSRLLGMRLRETAAALSVATKLRLTQQAQMHPRTAGRAMVGGHSRTKPWEFKGREE